MIYITQEQLKRELHHQPTTGEFHWIKRGRRRTIGKPVGHPNTRGYLVIQVNKQKYLAHRLAWLYVTGEFPSNDIDHINHVVYDNRFSNLRDVLHSDNQKNSLMHRDNASGKKGVYWHSNRNHWTSRIMVDGKDIYLGHYLNKDAAANAYDVAAKKYHGKFASTNN